MQSVKRIIPALIFLVFAVSPVSGAVGQTVPGESLEFVSWILYHTPEYIEISGDYLYVATNAFVIVDISDKKNPVEAACLHPLEKGWPRSFVVHGDYAYVYWQGHGIRIIDVSDKTNPRIVTDNFKADYDHGNLCMNYPYLYTFARVGRDRFYLFTIDVSDPLNPVFLGSLNLLKLGIGTEHFPMQMIADGGRVYFMFGPKGSDGTAKLHIIDVSSPSKPKPLSSLDVGRVRKGRDAWHNPHLALAKKKNYVYITGPFTDSPKSSIRIIDVSDPDRPFTAGTWNEKLDSADINIADNYACVTDHNNHMYIVDISDPLNIRERGEVRVKLPRYYGKNFCVKVCGNYAYMRMWDTHAVYIVDISDPDKPVIVKDIPFGHDLTDVSVCDSYVYASVWDYLQFYVVDMNKPESPVISKRVRVMGSAWGIDVKGGYAYLAMGVEGLNIFDISNPRAPKKTGQSFCGRGSQDVQLYVDEGEKIAYIAVGEPSLTAYGEGGGDGWHSSNNPGLRIVDVSDPSNPEEMSFYEFNSPAMGIHKSGKYVYVAAVDGGLHVFDVKDPKAPKLKGTWDPWNEYVRAVFVRDDYAYVACGDNLNVLSVRNPSKPFKVGGCPVGAACNDVVLEGKYAFVVTADALLVFDVSKPASPVKVASEKGVFSTPPAHLDVRMPYVYVACHNGGIYTFRMTSSADQKGGVDR